MIKSYQIHHPASTATPLAATRIRRGAESPAPAKAVGQKLPHAGSKLSQAEPGRRAIQHNPAKENAWISLDSLVRFETFQWVAPAPEAKLLFAAAEAGKCATLRPPGVRARKAKQWAHWTCSGLIGDHSADSDYEKQQSPHAPRLDDQLALRMRSGQ
jgi:hypothetical protein